MGRYFGRIGVAITSLTLVAGFAAADGITIPKGTAVDLVLADGLNSKTAKVGDTFRATFQRALYVDGLPALAQGTAVRGRVDAVRSLGDGAKSGFISVSFDRITLSGADEKEFEGKLTSLRQDDRRRLVELAPKVSTGRKIDVVLIGHSTTADNRAHTLVGDDLAPDYALTGLSATEVEVVVGTLLSMEFDEALTVSALDVKGAAASEARRIHVATKTVTAAQRSLMERKYYSGEADGLLGATTRQALARFQIDNGQIPTGDLDEETWRLLEAPVTSPRP